MNIDRSALWRFLESTKSAPVLPTPKEIEALFGPPDEIISNGDTLSPAVWGVSGEAPWYARYTAADRGREWIEYSTWSYRHNGDPCRSVDLMLRTADGALIGWIWFEDVPEGEETGPPGA